MCDVTVTLSAEVTKHISFPNLSLICFQLFAAGEFKCANLECFYLHGTQNRPFHYLDVFDH